MSAVVGLGMLDSGGFGLSVELDVYTAQHRPRDGRGPGGQDAHQVCPYSNATRGNIDVTLTVV